MGVINNVLKLSLVQSHLITFLQNFGPTNLMLWEGSIESKK